MGEPSDIHGHQVQDHTTVGYQQNMLSNLPVYREIPTDTEYQSSFVPQVLQGNSLQTNLQMSSYALQEHGFEKCQKDARNLCPQRVQSHLVSPGIRMQSSFQSSPVPVRKECSQISKSSLAPFGTPLQSSFHIHPVTTSNVCQPTSQNPLFSTGTHIQLSLPSHPVPSSNQNPQILQSCLVPPRTPMQSIIQMHQIPAISQNLQKSQGPLFAEATSKQSTLTWYPDSNRYLGPQVFQGPSMQTNPCKYSSPLMQQVLPQQGTHPINPGLSSCSLRSSTVRDFLNSQESTDTYGDPEVSSNAPESKKRKRISYSKHQKHLLQKYFDKCMYPGLEEREKLAKSFGVTEQQIQVWFKNHRVKFKKKNPNNVLQGIPETSGSSTADFGSTSSNDSAAHPDLPKGNEAPREPALAKGTASPEAPLLMEAASQGPEHAQDSGATTEELWQRVNEVLDERDDWLNFNYTMSQHASPGNWESILFGEILSQHRNM